MKTRLDFALSRPLLFSQMKPIQLVILALLFAISGSQAQAAFSGSEKTFYVGTGVTFYNMGKLTSSDNASTSLLGQLYVPHLQLTKQFPAFGLKFLSEVSFTPLAVKASDGVSKRIFTGSVSGLFGSGVVQLKTGFGILLYFVGGNGGAVTLNNGTSTQTFYSPGTTKSAKAFYLDLGVGFRLPSSIRIDLDLLATGALTTRRAFSTVFTLSKGIL